MWIIGQVIGIALNLYFFVLIARMILSWVPVLVPGWEPKGPFLVVAEVIYSLTDPPLKFLRKFLPPVQVGTVAFDLGFLALMVGLSVAMWLNALIFLR
ncbi:MAG TPA: YggT family protein [Candidatus Avipropionibacterium avicola]|uniref:YggT family protein n=1 Tax=Candidatus Avipropionibacterium avicola TaxID=2840701 RepID=A0A9D1GX46_9ACTN|nr:YggT family protein [Candidatus Avipropionibacterium avicola]